MVERVLKIKETKEGTLLPVLVVPKGKEFAIIGFDEWNHSLKIRPQEKPEKGRTIPGNPDLCLASMGNYICKNFVFRNVEGILLSFTSSNIISRNTVFRNDIGIHLLESSDNKFYRNWVFRNDINILVEP